MKDPAVLRSPIGDIKRIGPKKVEAFQRLGLSCLEDLLWNFPRSYEDRRNTKVISELLDGEKVLVRVRILLKRFGKGYGRKRTLRLLCEDNSGRMEVLFFMGGYMDKAFVMGDEYLFFGKVNVENGRVTMLHPTFNKAEAEDEGGIVPVYSLTKGLTQKDLRRCTAVALSEADNMEESLPTHIIESNNICGIEYAIRNIHRPADEKRYGEARYRLVYEELFDLRVALLLSRDRFGRGRAGISFSESIRASEFTGGLPYPLTGAQTRVLSEIETDMESDRAMNRLLQGDVGSGKTAIAQAALYKAVKSGYQAAFMAPTEILARQHFKTLTDDYKPYGICVEFLSGSVTGKERTRVLNAIETGQADIVVGTHAIISGNVTFSNLGLVVTDEQHRFGVNQRKLLSKKGENPDVLVMTATPIPRTLAVVLYGDLDISIIDELPKGRIPIETKQFDEASRQSAYKLARQELAQGRQVYVVAPLIEASEVMDGRSAEGLYEEISANFNEYKVALLHGAMKQKEKDDVMDGFNSGCISILVSTVVIEVGINVPNATVMIIENAERFGLAQLHQLRGRVGRGSHKSYCLIITDGENDIAKERADTLCSTNDGFIIAEKDLEQRGPGELFGYKQHGLPQLKLADPVKHGKIVAKAGQDALELVSLDPTLSNRENEGLSQKIRRSYTDIDSLTL